MHSLVVVAGVATVVLAGCGGGGDPVHPTGAPAVPGHNVVLNNDGRRAATLEIESGATAVNVAVGRSTDPLVTASTPQASGQVPVVSNGADGHVDVQLLAQGSGGPSALDLVVSPQVVWTIDLDGGATSETVDLRGGKASVVDLVGGVTRATVDLPAMSGTETVREVGGASELQVSAPRATLSRIEVDGGASSVRVGSATHTGIGGHQTFTDPGYSSATDRLEVGLQGGVSSVVVSG